MERATIFVQGRVQGVGFRWWVRARALELGLTGFARNLVDGRVEVCAQGDPAAVRALRALLEGQPGPAGRPGTVTGCTVQYGAPRDGIAGFTER
jgi:acylphosphatase